MERPTVTRRVIKQAQQGDPTAISTLYQAYVGIIYRYIAYRVGPEADIEDLTSEVFVRMVESLGSYRITGAPFEAWLYRIAAARVADYHRKRKRRPQAELSEEVISDGPAPEEHLLQSQETALLMEAIQQLSEDEQNILIMRFVERKSHQEVAEYLGKTVAAVKSAQHRALVRLANLLGSPEKARHYLRGRDV